MYNTMILGVDEVFDEDGTEFDEEDEEGVSHFG